MQLPAPAAQRQAAAHLRERVARQRHLAVVERANARLTFGSERHARALREEHRRIAQQAVGAISRQTEARASVG